MEYLKLFNTESEYLTYRDGKDYLKPNVSLSDDKGSVFYNFTPPPIVYEAVDLGLPSGTKWATMNVGARKPSDYGLYFQWGDTSGYTAEQIGNGDGQKKLSSDWSDYKWYDTSKKAFTKYTATGATLDLEDDAAHTNMGGSWHMPTPEQCQELIDNTTTAWTASGMAFTSKTDRSKSIFIPTAGNAWDGSVYGRGYGGYVWSSKLSLSYVIYGQHLGFGPPFAHLDNDNRFSGFSVRGVIG